MSNQHLDLIKMWRDLSRQPPYNPYFDKKWKPAFFKWAPYTSLSLCFFMTLSGFLGPDLPLSNFGWHLSIMATFMVSALLFLARKVKKIHRNPTIPLMMAHVVPLWGLLIIFVFFLIKLNFVANSKIEGRPISNIVREKIAERRELMEKQSNTIGTTVDQQQVQVEERIDEIKEHINERLEQRIAREVRTNIDNQRERMLKSWDETQARFHENLPFSGSKNKSAVPSTESSQDPKS